MSRNRNHVISPSKELEPFNEVILFVGTILALNPLIGLALNHSPFGITRSSALASLLPLLVTLTLIAIVSRRRAKAEDLPRGRGRDCLRPVLYVALPVAIAILLRTYPYLISGLPFSVDSWPSIRYAELLLVINSYIDPYTSVGRSSKIVNGSVGYSVILEGPK